MSLQEEFEFNFLGRYVGGQNAPIGTFVNPRTMAYYQQGSDGTLPADGNVWIMISTDNTKTASQIATLVNAGIGGAAYVAGSFHVRSSADNAQAPGTGADDA